MKIKFNELFKRTCSTVLAIACFMSSASFLPIEKFVVEASDAELDFYFTHNISKEKINETAVVLEGIKLNVNDNLKDINTSASAGSYNYNASTPFELLKNSSAPATPSVEQAAEHIALKGAYENVIAYAQPLLGLTTNYSQADEIAFNLTPQVQYSISSSTEEGSYLRYKGDIYSTTKTDLSSQMTVTSSPIVANFNINGGAMHLTATDNVIEFEYTGDAFDNMIRTMETSTGSDGTVVTQPPVEAWQPWRFNKNGEIDTDPNKTEWWRITTNTGYFEDYELVSVVANEQVNGTVESDVIRNFTFNLSNGNTTQDIGVKVQFGSLGVTKTVETGAAFKYEFLYKTTDFNLSFQVKTRADALFEIAEDISTNPTAYANNNSPATNSSSTLGYLKYNNLPYVASADPSKVSVTDMPQLDRNDISQTFFLKTRHAEYNYENGFYITWEWKPDGLEYVPDLTVYRDPGDAPDDTATQEVKDKYTEDLANYTTYLANKEDYEQNVDEYDRRIESNLEKVESVNVPDFNIVPATYDDDGNVTSHKWSTSGTTYASNGYMEVKVTPGEDNISGKLAATVHVFGDKNNYGIPIDGDTSDVRLGDAAYDGRGDTFAISSTRVTEVDIVVTGRGVDPRFYITSATAAKYEPENELADHYPYVSNGYVFEYEEGIQTRFPIFKYFEDDAEIREVKLTDGYSDALNMDVNNGSKDINKPPAVIPPGYTSPIPKAPWKVEGVFEFGSGIMQCDRLVVTNASEITSTANVKMEYRVNQTDPTAIATHNFATDGNSWEIPIDFTDFSAGADYAYYFILEAEKEGLMELDFHFYSGDSTESKVEYEGVGIQIGSSLPSSDALLDKVYLHMVQAETEDAAEDARIADILKNLFSDKSTTNASENPFSGRNPEYSNEFLPTDIIYNTDFTYNEAGDYYYYEVELPYVISDVRLTPIYDSVAQANNALYMTVSDPGVSSIVTGTGKKAGDYSGVSDAMPLITSNNSDTYDQPAKWMLIQTLAANSATKEKYYLKLVQAPAASEVVLNDMYVETDTLLGETVRLDLNNANGDVVTFETDPVGVGMRYYITLPYYYYSQKIPVDITAISNGSWSKSPTIVSDDGLSQPSKSFMASVLDQFSNETTESFYLNYDDLYGAGTNALGSSYPNKFTITTFSESTDATAVYYLTINVSAPDTDDDLSTLEVMDPSKDDAVLPFKNGGFVNTKNDYIIEIPYELQSYRFSVLPKSEKALKVRLIAPDDTVIAETMYANPGTPIQFLVNFNDLGLTSTDLDFTFKIAVQAENGIWSDQYQHPEGHTPYTILFQRDAPNTNSLLQSLDVLNFEDTTPIPEYVFEQVKKDYIFTVPYTTERIIIKPTAAEQDRTTITLNGVDFPDEDPGKDFYLKPGESNTFTIIVTAEDPAYTTTYNLYITRDKPDREARLLNLVVNGSDTMTPALFVPSTFTYDVTIPAGTETYTITPTAVSEHAIIMIDGKVIPSGTATEAYHAVDETVVKEVLVWAQDGETTETYTLNITNHNLIEKSDDAELLDAKFQGVDLAPKFLSNVYDYEIYTKPDTILLQIEPEISKGATVEVSVGSKKLDNIDNIYSTSFFTDTDAIKIVVTSESGNVSKTYVFDVFKNTEGKEGIFKPITSDMVDFVSENPIIVDISEYAVIDASVFNTMKDSYPEKTIVFTGNDYMLRMNGSDIKENIPHTVQYDFGFSFTSPEEKLIQAILDDSEYEEDAELEPIYLYFNDHTPLPARMILTAVLGSSVGNSQLYWNYYNAERDRIDYYGYVQSNSKGAITVPLTHLSTYMVTTQEIGASEDRTNTGFGSLDQGSHSSGQADGSIGSEGFGDDLTGGFGSGGNGDISGDLTTNKPNPQTNVYGFPVSTTERGMYEQTTVYKWYEEKRGKRKNNEESNDDQTDEC